MKEGFHTDEKKGEIRGGALRMRPIIGYEDGRSVVLGGYHGNLNTVSMMGCSKVKQVYWPLGWGCYWGVGSIQPREER